MTLSAGEWRRISGSASTGHGAFPIVIIMKMRVSNVTCHHFRGMRYSTRCPFLNFCLQQYICKRSFKCFLIIFCYRFASKVAQTLSKAGLKSSMGANGEPFVVMDGA